MDGWMEAMYQLKELLLGEDTPALAHVGVELGVVRLKLTRRRERGRPVSRRVAGRRERAEQRRRGGPC